MREEEEWRRVGWELQLQAERMRMGVLLQREEKTKRRLLQSCWHCVAPDRVVVLSV